jgi:filamentous hemagglutinin
MGKELNGPACSSANYLRLKNYFASQEIANGHAFEKHVLQKMEFGSFTKEQFRSHIENCLNNYSSMRYLERNRTAYWHASSNTVIIRDSSRIDGGTAFKPDLLYEYFKGNALK